MAHSFVQAGDGLRGGALLRGEHLRGAARAAERRIYVARYGELRVFKGGDNPACIYGFNCLKVAAAALQVLSAGVQEPYAKGCKHSGSAVIGCAAAKAYQELPASAVQGVQDDFSRAEAAGFPWVPFARGEQRKAAGGGYVNHCGPVRQNAVGRSDGPAERVGCIGIRHRSPGGLDYGFRRALTTIGNG